jgi:hypothetical protein
MFQKSIMRRSSSIMTMMMSFIMLSSFVLFAALVEAGTRPADLQWLQTKKLEDGVIETSSGLLYKGML